ncbi:protein-disulfide isomerase [Microbacterium marinum]|uniref:Protein-disulfide isomerase n=1 Tax=Microbacterium marinum TaxID=421115 RepID=A0A7W7BNV4_9MICO|nr:thioredoxin domain-containing protein [Microbacterium marinum]MBB4666085.1 protein-disulfide isomerase [Microbacterium marinum]
MTAAAGKTNWFAVWVSVAVVAVLAVVVGLVVWMNNSASAPGPVPASSGIDQETGAITFGDGPDTVATWVDFMCPYCGQFEETEGKTIAELVDDGSVTLEVYPVSILDRLSQGTEYSSRAASAMYAVADADPENAYSFFRALFEEQPAEQTAGMTDEELVQLAKDAGVDVTADLESAILDHEFIEFAKSQELPEGASGTPTLKVNDELVQVTFDPEVDILANLTSQ